MSKRYGHAIWGVRADRRFLSDQNWRQPVRWNVAAARAKVRARVFCASMADVFEDRRDLDAARDRLWALIGETPHLDWLLLTKRIDRVEQLAPWRDEWPANVWLGTTVEDQRRARERLPILTCIPAKVRFISAEPLLGSLDLRQWLHALDWVIAGGESGHHSRPSSPSWVKSIARQCRAAGVPLHFKQWGDWAPAPSNIIHHRQIARAADGSLMVRAGKKQSGRLLYGCEWNGLPQVRP